LRATWLARRVEADNFVPQDVVSGLDALGDCNEPCKIILDHQVGGPEVLRLVELGLFADFEELELGLIGRGLDSRAVVSFWGLQRHGLRKFGEHSRKVRRILPGRR